MRWSRCDGRVTVHLQLIPGPAVLTSTQRHQACALNHVVATSGFLHASTSCLMPTALLWHTPTVMPRKQWASSARTGPGKPLELAHMPLPRNEKPRT
jgi:hypothetical protein